MRRSVNLICDLHLLALELERNRLYAIASTPDPIVRLTTSSGDYLWLEIAQRFIVKQVDGGRFGRQWKCETLAYTYTVSRDREKRDELWAWHWDRDAGRWPHVHVAGARDHTATGRVSVEAVIRQLIHECEVPGRVGWEDVLDENEELFRLYRTWS
jgi:hypothetical protein